MSAPGKLITIEGVDGAGKTTLAAALERTLAEKGLPVTLLRELLYAAARAQLVQEALKPLLSSGRWVLLDRFVDSSLAYQGAGRGLGIEAIRELNHFATGDLTPNRTLLLALAGESARARTDTRGGVRDRLEREGAAFFDTIATAYRQLAEAEPERIRVLDANAAPEQVLARALEALGDLLPG